MAKFDGFKNLADGVHSLLLSAAVIAGGGWAAWEFSALLKAETAQSQLQLVQAEVAEKWAKMGAPLNFKIATAQLAPQGDERLLSVEVEVSNPGNRGTTMNIEDRPLRVARVSRNADGTLHAGPVAWVGKVKLRSAEEQADGAGEIAQVTHVVVLPGQIKTLAFLINVPGPGVYLVEFRASLDKSDASDWENAGMPAERTKSWMASKYIEVH